MDLVGLVASLRNLYFSFILKTKTQDIMSYSRGDYKALSSILCYNNLDLDEACATHENFRFMAKV
jgi:hypothetical protein